MREHDDEYLEGKGRNQNDYIADVKLSSCSLLGDLNGKCDASSTIVLDGQYLIGGRVSVGQTIEKVTNLLEVLTAFMHKQWPWTNPQGGLSK